MGEDDIVELFWKSGQVVGSSQAQRPYVPPPLVLRGSGSGSGGGGGEESAPVPQPPPPPLFISDQNLFMREDELASWLHHHPPPPSEEDELRSHLLYSGLISTPFAQPQGALPLTPPLPLPPPLPPPASVIYTPTVAERPTGQVVEAAGRRAENFINFSMLRGNVIFTGDRAEAAAAPWLPVVRDLTQVGLTATPTSAVTESCLIPVTVAPDGIAQTFAVPRAVCDIAGPTAPVVSRMETEQLQVQLAAMGTEGAEDERKRKEREEAGAGDTEETGGEARGSTSRKRSRAAEMHNFSERRRREKINEKMKTLQELIPRCNKTDKASMLDDAIEYVKSLQLQIQMISTGVPMMYAPNMQRFMPPSAMGMMGVNQPPFMPFPGRAFPRPAHVAGLPPPPPYPFAFDPSRVPLPTQQSNPVLNQPQFPGYFNPYSQFVGLQQMQQPPLRLPLPPLQNQTTAQLSFSQASGSKEPEDQANKPTG